MPSFKEIINKEKNPLIPCLEETTRGDPLVVGIVFSGGPAPGGNNVVAGVLDVLRNIHPESALIGFLKGPLGLIEQDICPLKKELVDRFRNLGGFDLLGTGRTKIESVEQLDRAVQTIKNLHLNGLVVVGGDDSNTNAYFLQKALQEKQVSCSVVGIPKTIDGDLKGKNLELSFGFDTACKVYSELIGNICIDAKSSLKYWHFIKLMGRKASHVALECALQTSPNIALIGEEIAEKGFSLKQVVSFLADGIEKRAREGKGYGVILISEGLIEFIADIRNLIEALNALIGKGEGVEKLCSAEKKQFFCLPEILQKRLLEDRDHHGNIAVSQIEMDKILSDLVAKELKQRGVKQTFRAVHHFFGYEGRCAYPSFFDATYGYNLGHIAVSLIRKKRLGKMATVENLKDEVERWRPSEVSLEEMLVEEDRGGKKKKVIAKALVDLKGDLFSYFLKKREVWLREDCYQNPGPIQFFGPTKKEKTKTLLFGP